MAPNNDHLASRMLDDLNRTVRDLCIRVSLLEAAKGAPSFPEQMLSLALGIASPRAWFIGALVVMVSFLSMLTREEVKHIGLELIEKLLQ